MTKLTKEHLLKVEKCSPLLPNPWREVAEELLGHIYTLDAEIADLKRQIAERDAELAAIRQTLDNAFNTGDGTYRP